MQHRIGHPNADAISGELGGADQRLIQESFGTSSLSRDGNFGACVQSFYPYLWEYSREMLESMQHTQPLYNASSTRLTFVVEMLLKASVGLDLEAKGGRYESTALHVSYFHGYYDIVSLLLKAGADPESTNCNRTTCLTWTRWKRFHDISDLLVRYGARR